MKKIAIIAQGFGGSTTSLIESFLHQGYSVDFYNIGDRRNITGSYETFDLPTKYTIGTINRVKSMNQNGLKRFSTYFGIKQFTMFQFICIGINLHNKLRYIINPISKLFLSRLIKVINNNQYDFINVIGQTPETTYLSIKLKKNRKNLVHSIHEVCKNHLVGNELNENVMCLIKNNIQLNVFSQKSADDLIRLSNNILPQYSIIPFSLFTGYQEFENIEITELLNTDDFILFFGFIQPYKGLTNLYNAIQLLKERGFHKKVVIAGKGYDLCLNSIKNDHNFIIINRWIGNNEVATLLRKCHVVVCPYLSSSQTGITQTVFNFDKPIIATKVPAFTNTIQHKKTGLLVDINDVTQLADAINLIYTDISLYRQLCKGVATIRKRATQEWTNIANMYIMKYIS